LQNVNVGLKKISITEEQKEKIEAMASQKMSGRKISIILGISQSTVWRNMEYMGLTKRVSVKKGDFFYWEDYDNSVI